MVKFGGSGKKKQACTLRKCNGINNSQQQQLQEQQTSLAETINSSKVVKEISVETKVVNTTKLWLSGY